MIIAQLDSSFEEIIIAGNIDEAQKTAKKATQKLE